jgi:hypothetical protein
MGRKRLLTILAAVTAAVTLQVGPAAAGTGDCLVLGEDVTLTQLVTLDPAICVVDSSGKLVQGTVEKTTEKTTETVEKTTESVTKTVEDTTKKVTGGSSTPAPTPTTDPAPTSPTSPTSPKSDGGGSNGGNTGGTTTAPKGGSSGSNVATSGDVREPQVSDEARDQQLGALRAIRSDLAAGTPLDRGMAGPVQPFGGLMTTDDLAAPQVADAGEAVPGVDGLDPQVAPAPEQREAVLANSSPMRDIAEAPLALQLLAAALVLGAATVWTIASRELGRGQTTTA